MTKPPTPEGTADEDEGIMLSALRGIAELYDCDGGDDGDCSCPPCRARHAIAKVDSWRFEGAVSERLTSGFNPRETRIVAAFRCYFRGDSDRKLAQVLRDERHDVTRRDWWVATSVVQWLATNCGMGILEQAGFKYSNYDADRKLIDERLPATLLDPRCPSCDAEAAAGRTFCGYCGRRLASGGKP